MGLRANYLPFLFALLFFSCDSTSIETNKFEGVWKTETGRHELEINGSGSNIEGYFRTHWNDPNYATIEEPYEGEMVHPDTLVLRRLIGLPVQVEFTDRTVIYMTTSDRLISVDNIHVQNIGVVHRLTMFR